MNEIQPFENLIDAIIKGFGVTPNDERLKAYASKIEAYRTQLQNPDITLDAVEKILNDLVKICNQAFSISRYRRMLQGKGTNEFVHTSKKDFSLNSITGQASTTTPGDVFILLDEFANRKFSVQTKQVFDILTLKLTSNFPYDESKRGLKKVTADEINKHRVVTLTVEEFMNSRGLKDKKEARKQLEQAMRDIYSASLEWHETAYVIPNGRKRAKETILHYKTRIGDTTISDFEKPIKNGAVVFKFTFDMAQYLSAAYIMEFPQALLTINNNNNPHSYYLGRKLALHYNMNIAKENANRISVKTLIDACPEMPKYDQIMNNSKDGHVMQKIIEPFERDMNALLDSGILNSWEYCNSGGVPLTDKQVEKIKEAPKGFFDEWVTWLVYFELDNYPDITTRLKEIDRRKKIAAKKTKK